MVVVWYACDVVRLWCGMVVVWYGCGMVWTTVWLWCASFEKNSKNKKEQCNIVNVTSSMFESMPVGRSS